MIDFDDLPERLRWLTWAYPVAYLFYLVLISLASFLAAITYMFDISSIGFPGDVNEPSTELVALLVLAAVLPIIPYVGELAFPGGTTIKMTPRRVHELNNRVEATWPASVDRARAQIENLPFEFPDLTQPPGGRQS